MSFRYRWKNGSPPSRDQAARSQYLLDENQFGSEHDRRLAEEHARKYLGVPTRTPDSDLSVLPQVAPPKR